MTDHEYTGKCWNLLACELEKLLASRNLHLDDLEDRASIHQEKVHRLKQSLLRPGCFPVLNTSEMQKVAEVFQLDDGELIRLRAAVLASSIEKMLMDRINQDDALQAAEMVLPVIFRAMEAQFSDNGDLGTIRGRDADQGKDGEQALEDALEALDSGDMALQLSYNVASHTERIAYVRAARNNFVTALAALNDVDDDIRSLRAWSVWYNDAKTGLESADSRLEDLGE